MTARDHYDALVAQVTRWAMEDVCGKGRPKTSGQLDEISQRVTSAFERQIFHLRFHKKQEWFMRLKGSIVAAVTGNRWGKSTAMVTTLLIAMLHCIPWARRDDQEEAYERFSKLHPKFEPPIKAILCGPDFTSWVPQVVIPKLKELIPWAALVTHQSRQQGQVIDGFELWNGSSLKILSYAGETTRMESWDAHIVGWDEPPPADKFIAASRGAIDRNSCHVMSFTPENLTDPWSYDAIYLPAHHVVDERTFEQALREKPPILVVRGSMRDNTFLDPAGIESQLALWRKIDPEVLAAREHGEYRHLAGRVWKSFSRERHVKELEMLV